MINLNDASFDGKEGAVIFNDGKAGVVENVALAVSKKKPEEKEGSPDYKLTFSDANGGTCNASYWYVTADTQYATISEQIQKQGKILKHVLHAIYGPGYEIPQFQSATQMLDGCMKLIREGLASGLKFRIFANYGSTQSVKNYIQPRSWVPFVEPMTVDIASTRLKAGNIDAMARLQQDSLVAPGVNGVANADDLVAGDDW
jgi:hypothetical protein